MYIIDYNGYMNPQFIYRAVFMSSFVGISSLYDAYKI
jgi:hypothetical protein